MNSAPVNTVSLWLSYLFHLSQLIQQALAVYSPLLLPILYQIGNKWGFVRDSVEAETASHRVR